MIYYIVRRVTDNAFVSEPKYGSVIGRSHLKDAPKLFLERKVAEDYRSAMNIQHPNSWVVDEVDVTTVSEGTVASEDE